MWNEIENKSTKYQVNPSILKIMVQTRKYEKPFTLGHSSFGQL
jgi:hypothetical protein